MSPDATFPDGFACLAERVAFWQSTVRSTQPLPRAAACEAVGALYRAAGKTTPRVAFFSSPLMGVCAWAALNCLTPGAALGRSLRGELSARYWQRSVHQRIAQIRACLSRPLAQQLAAPLASLGEQLLEIEATMQETLRFEARFAWADWRPGGVWQRLQEEIEGAENELEPALRDQLLQGIARLKAAATGLKTLPNLLPAALWGAWDCLREALDDCLEHLGVADAEVSSELAQAWIRQARSCHWWLPLEGLALLSERPCVLHLDHHGWLHGESTAAVRYLDGCALYAWHGVRVYPRIILDPGSITLAEIDSPRADPEIRRIKIARYGQGRYLKASGARLIHQDERGVLWRKERPGDSPLVMVEVRNCTPEPDGALKSFLLRVPVSINRASDAVAWTFGMDAASYAPVLET